MPLLRAFSASACSTTLPSTLLLCAYFSIFRLPQPPKSTLFPYTTLFRSCVGRRDADAIAVAPHVGLVRQTNTWRNGEDRKSTRLNSSHANISYAVFCLKKKNITQRTL